MRGQSYSDGREYDEYNYEEDYSEEEEPQPTLNPQFTTEAKNFKVQPGHTIRLPCQVDRLGKNFIFQIIIRQFSISGDLIFPSGGIFDKFPASRHFCINSQFLGKIL